MYTEEYIRKLLEVDRNTISRWRYRFSEFLSSSAIQKGTTRYYTEDDIRVLALINEYWSENPDYEDILARLYSKEHHNEEYWRLIYLSTPVFKKELPEDLFESPFYVMLDRRGMCEPILVARAYKYAGDTLITEARSYIEIPYDLIFPVLYNYRHAIELYLKIIVAYEHNSKQKMPHSLSKLVKDFKNLYKARMNPWIQEFLEKFDEVDQKGTAFRYTDELPDHVIEWAINLNQLKVAMNFLCERFEAFIREYSSRER